MPAPLHTVVETSAFLAKAAKIMTEAERAAIVDAVAGVPAAGDLLKGAGRPRKLRVPLEGRGKRGGARVIYWFHSGRYPAVCFGCLQRTKRPI